LSRFHWMDLASWRKRSTLTEESLESCCWKHECCALEQITTLQWQSPLLQRGMNQSRGEIPFLQPGDLRSVGTAEV
jgi:hypothetical protein